MLARTLLALGMLTMTLNAADEKAPIKEGDKFPDIALEAVQVEKIPGKKAGDTLSIKDLKGKNVVVFFYPKASTPGCTTESCGFRDLAEKFPADAVLIGASVDAAAAQTKFITEQKLPYPLLCDTDSKLVTALGIQSGKVAKRVTYVVDKEGVVSKIYGKVAVKDHPAEVLKYVEGLK